MNSIKRSLLLVALSLLLAACGGNKRETLQDRLQAGKLAPLEIYQEGIRLMAERKYQDARQWFRVIETHAPNSPFFADAKLRIADTYFFDQMATYIEASVEYRSFLTHFPNHRMADYATYQYAMCFFTEIERADRDQTSTLTAYTEFENLIDKFPLSPYVPKAKEKIDLCLLRLADHEFAVGYYYYRRGKGFEQSAELRLKRVINNYEGQYNELKTSFYLAETLWRRKKYKEAKYYYDDINRRFPDSDYQPFVVDKLARYARIEQDGRDPGELGDEVEADPLTDQ
ncbi:MAG: outer membrane protein assembly factor BamD [Acidobacteriota bacterium]|nr:outer membrane protein assembly factor BamD [Acidobacteriota bacterium]